MIIRRALIGFGVMVALIVVVGVSCSHQIQMAVVDHFVAQYIGPKPAFTHQMAEVQTYRVTMRDGVELDTRVYTPKGDGPWPTLLVRDPYQFSYYLTCHLYVRYGFACIHQDVRGQGVSEGDWYPLMHEADDGEDTLNWMTEQPWQNGNIALVGGSYVALVQWAVAGRLPPEVKTIVAPVAHGDFYDMTYRGGHFAQAIAGLWSTEIFYPLEEKSDAAEIWRTQVVPHRPALSVDPEIFQGAWPSYRDYITHPDRSDPYWNQPFYTELRASHEALPVPAMLVARWHDFFLEGMLERFDALPMRESSLLLIRPGDHAGNTNALTVDNDDHYEFATSVAWLNHHLKNEPLADVLAPGVLYYRNGADTWERSASWPPQSANQSLHLNRLDQALSCGGELTLSEPGNTGSISYVYDPDDPVPTRGGSFMLNPSVAPVAVAEQGVADCDRSDVLTFQSAAFPDGMRLAGSIDITLQLSSDAEDTAFTVKLSEVFADGRVLNIRDDITALSYRNGAPDRISYTPNTTIDLRFALAPIDWTVQSGSRLRLDISSSNAPAFPPHSNFAGLWSAQDSVQLATQTLRGGAVTLPVAPNE